MDTNFLDADFAGYAEGLLRLRSGRRLVSSFDLAQDKFVFSANFAPKASFVTKLCLRPQGHIKWPSYEAD